VSILNSINAALALIGSTAAADQQSFHQFYAQNLRASLFTGFFTLSGFLFSVKAFMVINMKKDIYESPAYLSRLERLRKVNKDLSSYGPLSRLSKLLFWTVMASFL
jgi:hypothetical protein